MANVSSLITIDKFVRNLLFKENKTNDDYLRYLQIACDGIRDMHMHDFAIEVTKKVTVDTTTNTFPYPNDYVYYTAIATVHNGRYWVYTRDNGLVPLRDDGVDLLHTTGLDEDYVQDLQTSMPNTAEGFAPSSLSSGGGYNQYYYKDDKKNRRFIVSGFTPNVVVLKYISNGIDADGDILISDKSKAALEAYVRWQLSEYDKEAMSHQNNKERRYMDERKRMRLLEVPTLDEIYDAIYASTGQGPRR